MAAFLPDEHPLFCKISGFALTQRTAADVVSHWAKNYILVTLQKCQKEQIIGQKCPSEN